MVRAVTNAIIIYLIDDIFQKLFLPDVAVNNP